MLTGLPRGGLQSRAGGWRLVTVPRIAAGGGNRPATKSHHGSRIRNEIRTSAAKSPANAFLSQVAQICRTSAARQVDIFRHLIRLSVVKEMECSTAILKGSSQRCEEAHSGPAPADQKFLLQRCLLRMTRAPAGGTGIFPRPPPVDGMAAVGPEANLRSSAQPPGSRAN